MILLKSKISNDAIIEICMELDINIVKAKSSDSGSLGLSDNNIRRVNEAA